MEEPKQLDIVQNGYQRALQNRYEEVDSFEEQERIVQAEVFQETLEIREESLTEMDIENMSEGQDSSNADENSESESESTMDLINLGDYKESDCSNDHIDADPKSFQRTNEKQIDSPIYLSPKKYNPNDYTQEFDPNNTEQPVIVVNPINELVIPADMPPLPPIKEVKIEPITYANEGMLSDLTKQIDDSIDRLTKNIDDITEESKCLNRQREDMEDKRREMEAQYEPLAPKKLMKEKKKTLNKSEEEEYYNELYKKLSGDQSTGKKEIQAKSESESQAEGESVRWLHESEAKGLTESDIQGLGESEVQGQAESKVQAIDESEV